MRKEQYEWNCKVIDEHLELVKRLRKKNLEFEEQIKQNEQPL